jgi:hypothetical protein
MFAVRRVARCRRRERLASVVAALALALAGSPGLAASLPCKPDPAEFSRQGYKVNRVVTQNPLDFFQAVSGALNQAKGLLPLQEGDTFTAAAYSAGVEILARAVKSDLGETARVKVVVVTASLENCQDQKLDVVYHVFAFNFPAFAAPRTEIRRDEIERPAPAAAENNVKGNYFTAPIAGYNASRHFFGGMAGNVALHGKLFSSIDYGFSGSASSSSANLAIAGAHDFHRSVLDHADYAFGFVHSNMPSVLTALRQSSVHLRFVGSSAAHARRSSDDDPGLTTQLRYAALMEGGNQQSDLPDIASTVGSSPIGIVKFAVGSTLRSHRQSAAVSYGLQLGSVKAAAEVDYVKQVLDFEWNGTVDWPWNAKKQDLHYPVHLQARGGWGKLWINGGVPLTERFYGGNAVGMFLPGADWEIRGGPFIRSIAQNRLAGTGLGGDSFAYVGFTVAPTVWAVPLVPKKLVASSDFQTAKERALDSAITIEKLYFEAQDPAAQSAAKDLDTLKPPAEAIQDLLTGLESKVPSAAESARAKAESAAARLVRIIISARSDPSQLNAVPGNVGAVRRALDNLNGQLVAVPELQPQGEELTKHFTDLQAESAKLTKDMKGIDVTGAEAKAKKDLGVVRPILDTFLNELDGIAMSPVLMGDVAVLHPDPLGTHYGVGFGVRFTFLNMNLTGGYAINPHPHPELPFRQGHGALFFSFEVADLFR